MFSSINDNDDVTRDLISAARYAPASAAKAPVADADTLRRAYEHGIKAQNIHLPWSFEEVEPELRASWLLNGEKVLWNDVRTTVKQGFEEEVIPADEKGNS
jgi:hypothetical protein